MSRSKWLVLCAAILLPSIVNTQSMRLQDAPLGSVVQIGSFNYIKIAENKYMQSTEVTCPDGTTVGGKYVKCFESKTKYEEQCSGVSGGCTYKETISSFDTTYDLYTCQKACPTGTTYQKDKDNCVCENGLPYQYLANYDAYACFPVTTTDFDYTGDVQTYTIPVNGTYKLEVWGAQGGYAFSSSYHGGYGGYSYGNIPLTVGQVLYVVVGGAGGNTTGYPAGSTGFNGGGPGYISAYYGGAGGGATHIATQTGVLSTLSADKSAVLIVAGGGGGGGYYDTGGAGGAGGGLNGSNGGNSGGATGGTQSSGGNGSITGQAQFGAGITGHCGGGGGGGYYGGGGGSHSSGGGGGSGYIGGVANGETLNGATKFADPDGITVTGHSGNGFARITFISVN